MESHIRFRSYSAKPLYNLHEHWLDCTDCELCELRSKVVLGRGDLPCKVLFVGEAPGRSEDSLGVPFIGPAGKLLQRILNEVWDRNGKRFSYAITNVVACIPLKEKSPERITGDPYQIREPSKDEAAACRSRLLEFIGIANPVRIALLGKIAQKHTEPAIKSYRRKKGNRLKEVQNFYHPAYLLRQGGHTALTYKKLVLQLAEFTQGV